MGASARQEACRILQCRNVCCDKPARLPHRPTKNTPSASPPAAADDEEEEDEEEEGKAETAGEDIDSSISASKKDVTFRLVPATAKTLIEEAS